MVDNSRMSRGARGSASCCNSSALPSCNSQNGASKTLMRKLQSIDFALAETVLYLDAYPHSKPALDYYHKLLCERERICEALAKSGVPTTCRDNVSTTDWEWINSPWPWQTEAN